MSGKRLLPMFLVATIFLLQGGDCLSLLVANQKAHDCCHKGPSNQQNTGPCCQVSSTSTVAQDHGKEKAQRIDFADTVFLPVWTSHVTSHYALTFAPSPGPLGTFPIPLLV